MMKRILVFITLITWGFLSTHAQINVDENKLKLEFEPILFFYSGRSLNGLYAVSADNNLWLGVYIMTTEIPPFIFENMISNLPDDPSVRVTAEFALNARYRIKLSKKWESNPYVGLILGWENIRIEDDALSDLDIGTFLITPHLGYELYIYKKMVYLNPQIRAVFYPGQTKSDPGRPEDLESFLFVPSISIGLRL